MAANTKTPDDKEVARPRTSPAQFVREVRQEASKVTWPTRKEWWVTTMMVFAMVAVATVFFFVVDIALAFIVKTILAS